MRRRHNGRAGTSGSDRGDQRARYREHSRPATGNDARSPEALRAAARWMEFHETALMPARRRGGEDEVRRVLHQACRNRIVQMTEAQIEQEVLDVMAAPDILT